MPQETPINKETHKKMHLDASDLVMNPRDTTIDDQMDHVVKECI